MTTDYYKPGDWNAVCFECGRKKKAGELKKHWQGYYVCPEHWEPRQPQDFVRAVPDVQTPPWVQPVPEEIFTARCDLWTSSSLADFGEVGCMRVGGVSSLSVLLESFDPTCIVGVAIIGKSIVGVL